MYSYDEVQEIDPPVIIRSGRKKYRRRILQEEIDVHFYRRSKRINKDVEKYRELDSIDAIDVISPREASQDANLDFIDNTTEKDISSR
jgi:hypothetical protein